MQHNHEVKFPQLEAIKTELKKNWPQYVIGAAAGAVLVAVAARYSSKSANINIGLELPKGIEVLFSNRMADHLEENGSAMVQIGNNGPFIDMIDWNHPKVIEQVNTLLA